MYKLYYIYNYLWKLSFIHCYFGSVLTYLLLSIPNPCTVVRPPSVVPLRSDLIRCHTSSYFPITLLYRHIWLKVAIRVGWSANLDISTIWNNIWRWLLLAILQGIITYWRHDLTLFTFMRRFGWIMELIIYRTLLRFFVNMAWVIVFVRWYTWIMCLITFGYYLCLLCIVNLVNIFGTWIAWLVCWAELNWHFFINPNMSVEELIRFVCSQDHYSIFKVLLLQLCHFLVHQ